MYQKKLFMAFALTMMLCGCDVWTDNPAVELATDENVTLRNYANTGCKSEGSETRNYLNLKETFEYEGKADGYLAVKHINAEFNCVPGEIKADVSIDKDRIVVTEWSTEDLARCHCPYDLSYEIGPLTSGATYTLCIGSKGKEREVAAFVYFASMSGTWE